MDVSVVIGTFGDWEWIDLAQQRAIPSAAAQKVPVHHVHGDTLAQARNKALEQVSTEWVIHLDADDELTPGYVEAMDRGLADVRVPSVSYQRKYREPRPPGMPRVAGHEHDCTAECLPEGNWCVIGTAVRADLVRSVGGWREFQWSEDWDLWLRCYLAGATFEAIPEAVYRAHVNFDSRNRAPDRAFKNKVHWDIHRANFPEEYVDAA